jgi:hypothetical protein
MELIRRRLGENLTLIFNIIIHVLNYLIIMINIVSNSANQLEIALHNFELPKSRSDLKDRLIKFGIDLNLHDKIFIEDSDGDRIELDELNITDNLKYYEKNKIRVTNFILLKFENNVKENYNFKHNNADDHIKLEFNGHISDYDKSFLYRDSDSIVYLDDNKFLNDLNKLLETFPNLNNFHKYNNLNNSIDNLSFAESIILSPADSCFQVMYKKYLNEFLNSLSNENEFQLFLETFKTNEQFTFLIENFSVEEIKLAKEMLIPFHNAMLYFNENRKGMITEIIKSLKNYIHQTKFLELKIKEEKKKFREIKESFERNKASFNKFMMEVTEQIEDINFNFHNDNFQPISFDDNLSKLFSFVVKVLCDLKENFNFNDSGNGNGNGNGKVFSLKSDKYSKSHTAIVDNNVKKCNHKFCTENTCPYKMQKAYNNKKEIFDRNLCEKIYKQDKLYQV